MLDKSAVHHSDVAFAEFLTGGETLARRVILIGFLVALPLRFLISNHYSLEL